MKVAFDKVSETSQYSIGHLVEGKIQFFAYFLLYVERVFFKVADWGILFVSAYDANNTQRYAFISLMKLVWNSSLMSEILDKLLLEFL